VPAARTVPRSSKRHSSLPILLLVCVGILEFGRAYQTWQVVTNASREGARVAVLPDYNDASVRARVRTYLKDGGSPPSFGTTPRRPTW
jgi:hypothetical protein